MNYSAIMNVCFYIMRTIKPKVIDESVDVLVIKIVCVLIEINGIVVIAICKKFIPHIGINQGVWI